jgi:hypothetical protein
VNSASDIETFRPEDALTFAQAEQAVVEALARTCERGGRELMVVATHLTGLPSPDLAVRHRMVRRWAEAAQGRIALALVVPPHLIDAEKFGVVAGRNFGLRGEVFTEEADAAEWLRLQR